MDGYIQRLVKGQAGQRYNFPQIVFPEKTNNKIRYNPNLFSFLILQLSQDAFRILTQSVHLPHGYLNCGTQH